MTDTTIPAGAMPVVPDATSGQSAQAQSDPPPATGSDEPLGDAGKGALQAERKAARDAIKRAEAAERELEALRTASQSEQEKAIAAARKEGATEAASKADARVRRSEVRRVLSAAGCVDVDIAAMASDFADLAVTEDGDVADLDKAVSSFKAAHPSLFGTRRPTGSADAGSTTAAGAPQTTFSRAQLRDPVFYQANKAAILAAQAAGRITG